MSEVVGEFLNCNARRCIGRQEGCGLFSRSALCRAQADSQGDRQKPCGDYHPTEFGNEFAYLFAPVSFAPPREARQKLAILRAPGKWASPIIVISARRSTALEASHLDLYTAFLPYLDQIG